MDSNIIELLKAPGKTQMRQRQNFFRPAPASIPIPSLETPIPSPTEEAPISTPSVQAPVPLPSFHSNIIELLKAPDKTQMRQRQNFFRPAPASIPIPSLKTPIPSPTEEAPISTPPVQAPVPLPSFHNFSCPQNPGMTSSTIGSPSSQKYDSSIETRKGGSRKIGGVKRNPDGLLRSKSKRGRKPGQTNSKIYIYIYHSYHPEKVAQLISDIDY